MTDAREADPYGDIKIYHKAKLMNEDTGEVSPLCAKKPKKLDMRKNFWTLIDSCVTCKKCLAAIKETNTHD